MTTVCYDRWGMENGEIRPISAGLLACRVRLRQRSAIKKEQELNTK